MYCSSCGVVVEPGLSYCKHCGTRLNRTDSVTKSPEVKPDLLVTSMVATFVFGLIGITALIGVMKAVLDLPVGTILGLMMLPLGLMFLLEGVFISLLLRRRHYKEAVEPMLPKGQATNELDTAHARALAEGVPSVTEHTTRAFDPIYNDRK